jgi:hypothetical protein
MKLVATAKWPRLDAASFTLALDEGRLEGKGHGLHGVMVTWPTEGGRAADSCGELRAEGGLEACTWGVPKNLPADPSAGVLRWLPAGGQAVPDAILFDEEGRRVPPETFVITPNRVELLVLVPADASVDVSSGVGLVPLAHADGVAGVECGTTRCSLANGALVVPSPAATVSAVDVKFRLAPHVVFGRKTPPDTQPVVRVAIVRCPMTVVSGPALRGVDTARVVVRLGGACARDIASLHFLVGVRQVTVMEIENVEDAAYAVLEIGNVDVPNLSIVAARGEGEATGAAAAVARTDTAPPPVVRAVLQIPGVPPLDFVPNNRRATVHLPRVAGAELALLPIQDVYDAWNEEGVTTVQGDINAVGAVALQFGYRVPTLPPPLNKVNLGVLTDALHRNVKEANVAAPFGTSAFSNAPLAEVLCTDTQGRVQRVQLGVPLHFPFSAREGCRVVIHRERLSPEYGTQKVALEIDVNKLDGTARSEGRVIQTLILRAGDEPRVAWIHGVVAPYDRVIVRLSHVADEAHYVDALDIATGAATVQWTVLFGTGRVRLYATTAIPTGLYRFGTSATSGVLSLSLGVISRFTWLDSEGHEGLLGLEAGMMAFGLTGQDQSTAGQPLTQVGAVAGLGLSIPIANAGGPAQAAINLHAWGEQRITGSGPEASSSRAIIFGPSISLGNIGTTF